jgi:hypothetical protein
MLGKTVLGAALGLAALTGSAGGAQEPCTPRNLIQGEVLFRHPDAPLGSGWTLTINLRTGEAQGRHPGGGAIRASAHVLCDGSKVLVSLPSVKGADGRELSPINCNLTRVDSRVTGNCSWHGAGTGQGPFDGNFIMQ